MANLLAYIVFRATGAEIRSRRRSGLRQGRSAGERLQNGNRACSLPWGNVSALSPWSRHDSPASATVCVRATTSPANGAFLLPRRYEMRSSSSRTRRSTKRICDLCVCADREKIHRFYNGLDLSSFAAPARLDERPSADPVGRAIDRGKRTRVLTGCLLGAARAGHRFRCEVVGAPSCPVRQRLHRDASRGPPPGPRRLRQFLDRCRSLVCWSAMAGGHLRGFVRVAKDGSNDNNANSLLEAMADASGGIDQDHAIPRLSRTAAVHSRAGRRIGRASRPDRSLIDDPGLRRWLGATPASRSRSASTSRRTFAPMWTVPRVMTRRILLASYEVPGLGGASTSAYACSEDATRPRDTHVRESDREWTFRICSTCWARVWQPQRAAGRAELYRGGMLYGGTNRWSGLSNASAGRDGRVQDIAAGLSNAPHRMCRRLLRGGCEQMKFHRSRDRARSGVTMSSARGDRFAPAAVVEGRKAGALGARISSWPGRSYEGAPRTVLFLPAHGKLWPTRSRTEWIDEAVNPWVRWRSPSPAAHGLLFVASSWSRSRKESEHGQTHRGKSSNARICIVGECAVSRAGPTSYGFVGMRTSSRPHGRRQAPSAPPVRCEPRGPSSKARRWVQTSWRRRTVATG